MWIDWRFAECGQTWLVLLNRSVFAALEPPKDEKFKKEKRERASSKRWKPLRSLTQTDRGGNGEACEGKDEGKKGENKEKCVIGVLFVNAQFTNISDVCCVETDGLRNESREQKIDICSPPNKTLTELDTVTTISNHAEMWKQVVLNYR